MQGIRVMTDVGGFSSVIVFSTCLYDEAKISSRSIEADYGSATPQKQKNEAHIMLTLVNRYSLFFIYKMLK